MIKSSASDRKRTPGRHCRTVGCGGVVKQIKRKNCATHIKRRFSCKRCGLRWTSVERDLVNSIDTEGKYGTSAAKRRLAEWQAKTQSPPVCPTPRDLFSKLDGLLTGD